MTTTRNISFISLKWLKKLHGESRMLGGGLQPLSGAVRLAEIPYLTGCHVSVAVDLGSLETFPIISQS
jgi:hypothetical protein